MNNFFIFCSGIHASFLKRCPSENNKYVGLGATVFFTGILAFFSSAYAFYTVFNSVIISILLGVVWGLMIFNLDRYIVSSMRKVGSRWNQFLMAFPRLIFAMIIALVISKPIEMKLFESEINAEIISMEQKKYREQELLLNSRFSDEELKLENEVEMLQNAIIGKELYKNEMIAHALAEADGTGGSMQRNLGPIYKIKQEKAEAAIYDWENTKADIEPQILIKKAELTQISNSRNEALSELQLVPLTGFASRLKALGNLSADEGSIFIAGVFLTLLFILLETAPIFVKLISLEGPLDYVQAKHESLYWQSFNLHKNKLKVKRDYASKTINHAGIKVIEKENELVNDLLQTEVERVKADGLSFLSINKWKEQVSQLLS
jgi:hypothetical protein